MTDRHDTTPHAPARGRLPEPDAHAPGGEGGHGDHSRSEEDRIHTAKIVWVGVGALVVFFIAAVASTTYFNLKVAERPKLPIPPEIGQSKIGMVEQQLFEVSFRGENDRNARRAKLGAYGWIDREQGIAHMPIERAMELAAKGVRAPSAAPAAPPRGAL
jgi:hypothetical protein